MNDALMLAILCVNDGIYMFIGNCRMEWMLLATV